MTLRDSLTEHHEQDYWQVAETRWADGTATYLVTLSPHVRVTILGEPTRPMTYSITYTRLGRVQKWLTFSGGKTDINLTDAQAQRQMARFLRRAVCPICFGRMFLHQAGSYACLECGAVAVYVEETDIVSYAANLEAGNLTSQGHSLTVASILRGLEPITAVAKNHGRYIVGDWKHSLENAALGLFMEMSDGIR